MDVLKIRHLISNFGSRSASEIPGTTPQAIAQEAKTELLTLAARKRVQLSRCLTLGMLTLLYQPAYGQSEESDPWGFINRPLYEFNTLFDGYLVRPIAVSYNKHMPDLAKRGVRNFFNNLDDVNVVVNDLMQLKLRNALNDSGRLVLNTTVGVGGLFDVAANLGMYKNYEDFGQTLGYWGVGDGGYLVLPLLGASTVRDTAGLFADAVFNPIFWVTDSKVRTTLYAADTVDTRVSYLAAETMISGDEYEFVRNAYLQRRAYLVADGEVFDEFDDY